MSSRIVFGYESASQSYCFTFVYIPKITRQNKLTLQDNNHNPELPEAGEHCGNRRLR